MYGSTTEPPCSGTKLFGTLNGISFFTKLHLSNQEDPGVLDPSPVDVYKQI